MEINIYKKDGSKAGTVELSDVFQEPFRPDLLRKAVSVAQANRRQAYGSDPRAGKKRVVTSWGPGRGASRVPRVHGTSRAGYAPGTVGGRRAHPPRPDRDWSESINKKERRKALRSALAATAQATLVADRGHRFAEDRTLPVVLQDDITGITSTQELAQVLENVGLGDDLQRASEGRSIRAGIGKLRGRKYRTPRSLLLVAHETENLFRAARNLPGVEVCTPQQVNVERLAPGGDGGRLLVTTESGLRGLEGVIA